MMATCGEIEAKNSECNWRRFHAVEQEMISIEENRRDAKCHLYVHTNH